MARRVSTRRVKKHRHYTYESAADALGVTPQTVRSWRAQGLMVLSDRRPHFILGEALIEFLSARQKTRTVRMAKDQFMCFTCRAPQHPYGMMVDYVPINPARGRLIALCETCEGRCQRFVSKASLADLGGVFQIVRRSGSQA